MARHTAPRGVTLPVPFWWLDAVRKAKEGLSNIRVAELVSSATGRRYDDSQISRALTEDDDKRIAATDLVDALSDLFDIPRPFYIAASEDEARRFATQRKLTALNAKKSEIAAGVKNLHNPDQGGPIHSRHGGEVAQGSHPRRVAPGRRKATQD